MFKFYAELENRAKYEAVNNHHTLDVVQFTEQGTEPKVCHKKLRHDEIVLWLSQKSTSDTSLEGQSTVKARMRALVCVAARPLNTGVVIVPVTRNVYDKIEKTFNLDRGVLGYIIAEGVAAIEFKAFNGGFGLLAILKLKHIVITYDPATTTTYVLARTTCDHEADVFIDLLKKTCTETPLVTAILASWITEMLQLRVRVVQDKKRAILSIERKTGLHSEFETKHARFERKDLLVLTHEFMLMKNAAGDTALKFLLELLEGTSDLEKKFAIESLISQPPPSKELRIRISQLRRHINNSQIIREEIDRRADVLLQTTYNLIAQRDNDVNVRIAIATQEDAAAQKQIAEDMSDVARRTYRDSANMKAMTLINLCCLPGTFAATFFSAGFFDFYYETPSGIVSPWIWLYWVIVTALTGVLYLVWTIMSRKMEQDLKNSGPTPTIEGPPGNIESTDIERDKDPRSAVAPSNTPERRPQEGDIARDADADSDSSFELTWLRFKRIGQSLDSDQCPICFVKPHNQPGIASRS